ncbi:hypothetical protein CAI21_01825 [Alkalilimnicola ehrlichii]|uniref:PaaI family thioesterase n=1 Tax=Alkalilimnicola ehrlichii TaxID=351052 RepID=UPI000E2E6B51|nr:PaaI family thioesterase [Alkalilimnicola ehrlichii]RFA31381.1 hypothetical protein CAI21_01825 [Alkalilimnicola ehrlichii]
MRSSQPPPIPGWQKRLRRSNLLRLWVARVFFRSIPHGRYIKLKPIGYRGRELTARMPYQEALIGNLETGALHSGAITALVDQTSGAAASLAVYPPSMVATLDLRLDYLRPAKAGAAIYACAEAYRVTKRIVFVRCTAHDGDREDPIAVGMSSFMRNGPIVKIP